MTNATALLRLATRSILLHRQLELGRWLVAGFELTQQLIQFEVAAASRHAALHWSPQYGTV
jgi:hypothetical protein